MSLESFLVVAAIIFSIGLYGALSKRHAIAVLMSIELMFNAVNVTAVALSRYVVPARVLQEAQTTITRDIEGAAQFVLTGQVFAVFIITVARRRGSAGPRHHHRHLPHQAVGLRHRHQPDEEVE